jgi:hypothetical protein
MKKIAIVGPEASKWTHEQEVLAKVKILEILANTDILVSGHCPKGGIDIWAEEIADFNGISKFIFAPDVEQWEDKIFFVAPDTGIKFSHLGYKSRNILIAETCDVLYCIVPKNGDDDSVWSLSTFCKHCKRFGHPSNGGCWTMNYAKKLGKETHLVII